MSELSEKILLALDGSEESTLAARTANGLARKLGSEPYVVHVAAMPNAYAFPEPVLVDREFRDQMRERAEQEAGAMLDEQVKGVEQAGGNISCAHMKVGRPDAEIVPKNWGASVLRSLPLAPVTSDLSDVRRFFAASPPPRPSQ